ncbi:MAG: M48 family metallopeptidase [Candidatus Izemoplasmatales bacterium]|nr:M48 family metallopeptidase [Candidatus Izemoplasmatales bacterium]
MYAGYVILVLVLFLGTTIFQITISVLNYKNRFQTLPESVSDVYEEKKYKNWLSYFMDNFKFQTLQSVLNTIFILILLVTGFFPFIYGLTNELTSSVEVMTLLFVFVYFLLSFITESFFSYYQLFTIEEKYGFNKTTKKTFFLDKLKGFLLSIILGGGLLYLICILFASVGFMFYLYVYLILSTITVLINLLYVKLFVPIFNKLKPLEEGPLKEEIMSFAKSVGYEINKISVIDASKRSSKLNAYFTGFGKMKQIVLYDTLIEKMTVEEIVAVLAHEIGHNKHKHIISGLIQSLVVLAGYVFALYFILNIEGFYLAFGFDQIFLGFGLILFLLLLSPLEVLLGFLFNSISRVHEYQADLYSAKHYSGKAMVSALKNIARNNFSNLTPHPTYVKLTYSHPPIPDRIKAIEAIYPRVVENAEIEDNA